MHLALNLNGKTKQECASTVSNKQLRIWPMATYNLYNAPVVDKGAMVSHGLRLIENDETAEAYLHEHRHGEECDEKCVEITLND